MIVEIRPKTGDKFHGATGKDDFAQPIKWPAPVNPETRQYDVDFTEEDLEVLDKTNIDISLQPEYDQDGYLKPHPTWDTKLGELKLLNHPFTLDTDIVTERIKYAVAKRCPLVAPREDLIGTPSYQNAKFYIFSEDLQMEAKADKVALKRKAQEESFKLTQDEKISLAWILAGKNLKGKSESMVNVVIDEQVTEDPEKFLKFASMDKAYLATRGLVEEALFKNVLTKYGGSIRYGSETIGPNEEAATNYLLENKNQVLKIAIADKLGK